MRIIRNIVVTAALALAAVSCKTSDKIVYLQDIDPTVSTTVDPKNSITIQPKDRLSIIVTCKDPEMASIFNLPTVNYQYGSETVKDGGTQRLIGYAVDEQGCIDFPQLGSIKVAGLNRWQLQDKIRDELVSRKLLNDMVVTVQFMNFKISVLGEVNKPGSYRIEGDKVSILEAISMAQDLTIYGQRDQVYVIREDNNQRTTYKVDLRSKKLFDSPVYYLKQNDVVYIQPNKVRAGQSNINENSMKSVTIWISIASLLSSLGVLVATIIDNKKN
ncbi:MAG: polysaccharide biosynthesis/export family protein [Candidatus Limisoma sp.]